MAVIEFGEFLPDLPDLNNNGVTLAKGVRPGGKSYKSFPSTSTYSTTALDATCQGGISVRDKTGNAFTYVGNASKLYEMQASVFSDVSKVGGYNTSNDETWEFIKWNEQLIATNFNDAIQAITLGGANFADLAGNPPKARHIAVVGNFVVLGNVNDTAGDGLVPYRVQWSGFEDETSWGVDTATQADYEDLEETGGAVQRVIGGSNGIIFRETSIHRMTYIGSPSVFQFDLIESNRGTPAPNSVIKIGNLIAYLGIDGFYIFDGNSSIPIGENKVNKFFYDDLDTTYYHKIFASVDPNQQIIYWAYPGSGNTNGRCNRIIMYNYSPSALKRWSYIDDIDVTFFFNSFSESYTLDGLDAVSTNLDALAFSLDSSVWITRNLLLSGFDSNNYLVNFNGDAVDATLETPEFQLFDGQRSNVTMVRPVLDGSASLSLYVGTRNLQSEAVTWSAAKTINSNGEFPCRENARFHRFRLTTSGNFNDAMGFEIPKAEAVGRR